MMGFALGIITVLAILIGLPLTFYAISVGGKKIGAGSEKLLPIVAGIVVIISMWWYFDSTLLLTAIVLIAGGAALLLWSTAPDMIKTIGGFMVGGGALLGLILLLVGPSAVEYRKDQLTAVVGGQAAPPSPPLSPAEQAQRLERERQEAEVARIRATSAAAAQAEATEAARLARLVTTRLQDSVRVVHCDQGWSEPVMIPAGWYMRYSWPGRTTGVEYLQDGYWKKALTAQVSGNVEAFRFCSTSLANLNLNGGYMPLAWNPN